ncbi:hypothetical protein D0817_20010 [Flavobacterium cupreum]|uniref:Uncharacterized protein n=1 Tax=Flavobacterium cupreum TaxID=2133766 RepID=A0A434A2V0_9FLAO|nr:hypothetical protein D0817_20010 [Flavobacterium cupreum]TDO67861.1 hypothetical protein EV143_1263 [Flavobacterium sp. P3160]
MNEYIQISKNFIKGDVITSCDELIELARLKKSVYHYGMKIKPASVIINMSYTVVYSMVSRGSLHKIIKFKPLKIK